MDWFATAWKNGIYDEFVTGTTYALMVLCAIILLRSRRPPGNTIAWLAAIVFMPYVGMPLFLMLGGRKMEARRERYKAPIYARVPYGTTESAGSRLQRILRSAGAPEPVRNERIEFHDTGERAYESLVQSIRAAGRTIDLATFTLEGDATGKAILKELTSKAAEGVRVRLLLDAVGSHLLRRPRLKAFREAGGEVAFFMPIIHVPFRGRVNLRNHRKLAIFDGEAAWFGGMNLARQYLGPQPRKRRWIDTSIWVKGKLIRQLQSVFECDWEFAGGMAQARSGIVVDKPDDLAPRPLEKSGGLAQAVASGPDVPGDPLYEALLEACFEASSRLWIATPYFVPDESLIKALELACRRGVDVRLLIPAHSDHWFADWSRGSYVRQVEAAGGRIFLSPRMLHAKLVVVDDTFALTGSANFDLRSLLYNYELGVFLLAHDEIAASAAWMERVFAQSRVGYPRLTFWREMIEGIGRIFGPLV